MRYYHSLQTGVNTGISSRLGILPFFRTPMVRFHPRMATQKTLLTIFSRPGCHLCDVVEKMAHRLENELRLEVSRRNIEDDAELLRRYGDRVPVVVLDQIEVCSGRITQPALRQGIKWAGAKARWRKPISRILSYLSRTPRQG